MKYRRNINAIDKATGKIVQLSMSAETVEKLQALAEAAAEYRRRFISVRGPLFPERKKGRSKRGWTTPAVGVAVN